MRIYIITAVFPPEPLTSAQTSADLAEELVKCGHEVTVLAPFPNRPKGELFPGFKRKLSFQRSLNGYKVVHCWHSLSKHSNFVSRMMENLSFALSTTIQIVRDSKPDVVYMNTWSIIAQNLNSFVLKAIKVPIVCAVQDIYPESLIDKALLNPQSRLARLMNHLDTAHLNRCSHIITLSPGMADLLRETRKLSSDRVMVIPNWIDADNFPYYPSTSGNFRRQHHISDNVFVAMFAGSLTLSPGVGLYVEVAEMLKENENILILLVGDGSLRSKLEKEISERGLTNIRVIFPLLPSDVPIVQAAADVLLLSLKGSMSHSAAPSKQVSYLFSGRPIVASLPADGYPAKIIREAYCGFILPPGDAGALAALLIKLATDPSPLDQLGRNAREYAIKHFAKSTVLPRMVELIKSCKANR